MSQRAAIPVFILFAGFAFAQHGSGSHHPFPGPAAPAQPHSHQDMFGFNRLNQIMNTFPMQFGRNIAGLAPLATGRSGPARPHAVLVGAIPGLWPYGYQEPPPQPVVTLYAPPPPVAVVINNSFSPQMGPPLVETSAPLFDTTVKSYTAPPSASELRRSARSSAKTENAAPIYLIAFKDGSLVSAYAYWIEDGNLHCVTTTNARKQAPLGDVDIDLTERLNHERGVEFQLSGE